MNVTEVLEAAWQAVQAARIPEDLREVAFEQAVGLVAGPSAGASAARQSGPGGKGSKPKAASGGNGAGEATDAGPVIEDEDEFFATFLSESGVEEEVLRSVYFIKDGRVRLSLSRRALGESLAAKNRTVAMLTLGARHYVEGEMSLKITEIRDAIKPHGYDPTRNLSSHLDAIPGTQAIGAGNDRAVRVQSGKFDTPFKELIERITAD